MRIVHYLNQFFGGLGGEAHADAQLTVQQGPVGPGRVLAAKLQATGDELVATLICGDNTAQFDPKRVAHNVVDRLTELEADLLLAGPAFESGRYGLACASVAAAAHHAGVPAMVGMHPENPGVGLCPAGVPVVTAGENAADMLPTLERMVLVARRLARGERLSRQERESCVRRDIRKNRIDDTRAATRAVSLLLQKIRKEDFETELPPPRFPRVEPAAPIEASSARIALVTTGGLVPRGNPDRLEASSASKWLSYPIDGMQTLTSEDFECIHAGIDTSHVNANPNRLVPLDICSELKGRGLAGDFDSELVVTVGNLTPVANAEQFAAEIAQRLQGRQVDAVMLTST